MTKYTEPELYITLFVKGKKLGIDMHDFAVFLDDTIWEVINFDCRSRWDSSQYDEAIHCWNVVKESDRIESAQLLMREVVYMKPENITAEEQNAIERVRSAFHMKRPHAFDSKLYLEMKEKITGIRYPLY